MKDRMRRLMALSLAVTLCAGSLPVQAETAQTEMEAGAEISEKKEKAQTEREELPSETQVTEKKSVELQSETAASSCVSETEGSKEKGTENPDETASEQEKTESESESTASETDSEKEKESAYGTEKETRNEKETGELQERETLTEKDQTERGQSEEETAQDSEKKKSDTENKEEESAEKQKCIVKAEDGSVLTKTPIQTPETLTVGSETYPVDYRQGVSKVTVPEGTKTLQIEVPDRSENEKLRLSRWNGYLTELEQTWYLCMDEPMEDAYTIQGTVYTVELERYELSLQEITKEQLAVYGELDADTEYAEILLGSGERSELLLIEYASEEESETEEQTENESEEGFTAETLPETEEATELSALEEEEAGIALYAASASEINSVYSSTGKNLADSAKKYTPTVSSINGEWQILGLVRSGQAVDESVYTKYLANVTQTLIDNNGVLHKKKYTDYSRVILALTSLGCDVTNVAGYNLLEPLSDYDQTVWQGVNGAIWALIAVDSHGYEFPTAAAGKTQNSRSKLIQNILDQEVSGGGWDLSGKSADPDVTAMALQALAPYYSTDAEVKKAVDRGISKLSAIQKKNGSYATYGSETSESCSQVIVALTALGIDPNTDSRFVKNGKSVVDALLTYANKDGSFKHVLSGSADQMATEQAYYALTAYERFTGGKTRLYDMTDVSLPSDPDQKPDQSESGNETDDSGTEKNETEKNEIDSNGKENTESNKETDKETNKQTEAQKKPSGSTHQVNLVSSNKKGSTSAGGSSSGTGIGGTSGTGKKTESETEESTESEEHRTGTKKGSTKTDKEVTSLLSELNGLFRKTKTSDKLPEDAADYTDAQKQQILDIYRMYTELSAEQKKEVEESKNYAAYEEVLEKYKAANHYDEGTGTDLRENEEDVLPWYVQVEAGALLAEDELETSVKEVLKEKGALLSYMNISLMDLLQDTIWQPGDLIRVSIPMTDLGEYEHVAVVHVKEDGSMEFLEAHIAGSNLEFDTDHFSRFGIVGYNGSMEELMQEETPDNFWIYLIPGAGAAVLLGLLALIRIISGKRKTAAEKRSDKVYDRKNDTKEMGKE